MFQIPRRIAYWSFFFCFAGKLALAQEKGNPTLNLEPEVWEEVLRFGAIFAGAMLLPVVLISTTAFLRVFLTLAFLKKALSISECLPIILLFALSLLLGALIMMPTYQKVYRTSLLPYLDKQLSPQQAIQKGIQPFREFMFSHVRQKDLALFVELSMKASPKSKEDIPTRVLLPAFLTSELHRGFAMGVFLFLPFLLIDILVASVLAALNMQTLPHQNIALPVKIALFVSVDGWSLLFSGIWKSFH
ncbi:MAG: flagellar biosynthetic protein FliP [Planctomycetota bacterium]|nr:MAG: flagellar biosynthetic protein FliP [Planctomycetota bacterium]